jgi:hypothetical protein
MNRTGTDSASSKFSVFYKVGVMSDAQWDLLRRDDLPASGVRWACFVEESPGFTVIYLLQFRGDTVLRRERPPRMKELAIQIRDQLKTVPDGFYQVSLLNHNSSNIVSIAEEELGGTRFTLRGKIVEKSFNSPNTYVWTQLVGRTDSGQGFLIQDQRIRSGALLPSALMSEALNFLPVSSSYEVLKWANLRTPWRQATQRSEEGEESEEIYSVALLDDALALELIDAYLHEMFTTKISRPNSRLKKLALEVVDSPESIMDGMIFRLAEEANQHDWGIEEIPPTRRAALCLQFATALKVRPRGLPQQPSVDVVAASLQIALNKTRNPASDASRVITTFCEWLTGKPETLERHSIGSHHIAGAEDRLREVLIRTPGLVNYIEGGTVLPHLVLTQEAFASLLVAGRFDRYLSSWRNGRIAWKAAGERSVSVLTRLFPGTREWIGIPTSNLTDLIDCLVPGRENLGRSRLTLLDGKIDARLLKAIANELDKVVPESENESELQVYLDLEPGTVQVLLMNLSPTNQPVIDVGKNAIRLLPWISENDGNARFSSFIEVPANDFSLDSLKPIIGPIDVDLSQRPKMRPRRNLDQSHLSNEDFCGREELLREARDTLFEMDSSPMIVIFGPRRAGKTTLGARIASDAVTSRDVAFSFEVDLGSDFDLTNPTALLPSLSRFVIGQALKQGIELSPHAAKDDFTSALIEIDEILSHQGRKALAFLDEFDVLCNRFSAPEMRETVRRLAARNWESLKIVCTVQRFSVEEMEFKQAHMIECSPDLSWADMLRYFARVGVERNSVRLLDEPIVTPDEIAEMLRPSIGLRPYWWAQIKTQLDVETRTSSTLSRFASSELIAECIENLSEDSFLLQLQREGDESSSLNNRLQDLYSREEKLVLVHMARNNGTMVAKDAQGHVNALRELQGRYLVARSKDNWVAIDPVMMAYVAKNADILVAL